MQLARPAPCLPAVQLASSLTGTRLVSLALAASMAFVLYRAWPEPDAADTVVARPGPTYTYVPLTGDPGWACQRAQETQSAGCAPFIAPLIAHPNWSLQLVDGASGCTGDSIANTFEVFSDGSVFWQAANMPDRVLHLTGTELALITRANDFPCGSTGYPGYSMAWIRIAPGGDPDGRAGVALPNSSLAGGMLDAVMRGAIARYNEERLAAIGPFEVHLAGRIEGVPLRVAVTPAGHLVVRHGRRVVVDQALEHGELASLFDQLTTRIAVSPETSWAPVLRGTLRAAHVELPVSIELVSADAGQQPGLAALWWLVTSAATELESAR